MKNFYVSIVTLFSLVAFAQNECNTIVINDTEEQNGIFISGNQGQRAAADIPIAEGQTITISQIKVTLASKEMPTYINFRFYDNVFFVPEDPEVASSYVPDEILFDVTNTTIGEAVELAYDEMHDFYIRNITVILAEPIVLNGDNVEDRYWMGVLSDAKAWASTAHYETGKDVIGESLAMGSPEWFQMKNLEMVYELTAECNFLGTKEFSAALLDIFPNPAESSLTVALPEGITLAKTEIYTATGQKVKEIFSGYEKIDVSALSSGIYMIKAQTTDNRVINSKFIKQ